MGSRQVIEERQAEDPALQELLKFLDLAMERREDLVPSVPVDNAWHRLLEDPAAYRELCRRRYGAVPGHDGGRTDIAAPYARTRALMTERFGTIDPSLWPDDAAAGCGVRAPQD
jgi:hypothetical protein